MKNSEDTQGALPVSWLPRAAELHAERTALVGEGQRLSYAELYESVSRLAASVTERGLVPGSPFAVVTRDAWRIARALYLSLHTGSALWPLDPRDADLRDQLPRTGIGLAFVDEGVIMPEQVLGLPGDLLEATPAGPKTRPRAGLPRDVQLVVATSGSTGAPRGVMLSAANLSAAVTASRARLALQTDDVWMACLPLHHIGGISIPLRALEVGAAVVLHQQFEASRVRSALHEYGVTHLSLVPPLLERLLADAPTERPPASLRVVLLGGGPIAESLVRRAVDSGWPVCPSYGLSENASQVATLHHATRDWAAGDVGPPLDGVRVEIVDEAGRPTSSEGRIRISGPTVTAGYVNSRWSSGDGLVDGRFTTSDLGYLDARGHLHVLGRADDVIVSGGENVSPERVEALIRGCAGIVDTGVVGIHDPVWGQRIVAVFTGAAEERELEDWCRVHIPSPMRPRGYLKLAELPRNPMGKLNRLELRRRVEDAFD